MRVVVAMSGGVDSSVAAYLMKQAGHDVIGMTMKIWPGEAKAAEGQRSCCGTDAVQDARRVAQILDIPYYVMDMVDTFEQKVIGNFVSEYMAGRTPHPCITCNTDMKFGQLLVKAREVKADKVATGHYARLVLDEATGRYQVFRAGSMEKDQSYALWGLTQEQLSRALFPLGELDKPRVREIAHELGLPVADKPDSQEICFVSTGNYRDFIAGKAPQPGPGAFVDAAGNTLGEHPGYTHFTIGQRRGLGVAMGDPRYVIQIRPTTNQVVLGTEAELARHTFEVRGVNWLAIGAPAEPVDCLVKIRYNGPPRAGRVVAAGDGRVSVMANEPFRAVTPGQSAVFYAEDGMVLGGGFIK